MINAQINRAIYKFITGDCHHFWMFGINVDYVCNYCGVELDEHGALANNIPLPDYCSDRNLCADVIKRMGWKQKQIFMEHLAGLTGHIQVANFLAANPRLWAEAIYKTLKETK